MNLRDFQRLVAIGENLHIEFKRRVPEPERIAKEVIALANSAGGKILIGVDDDGTITGVRDAEEEIFALEQALQTLIEPRVQLEIEIIPLQRRRDAVAVHIPNSARKPHFLIVPNEPRKAAYVRVGEKSIEASKEVVRLMRSQRQAQDVQFEFGEKERRLMAYLDRYERITVDQFARLADVPRKSAAQTLVLLVKANVLEVHPQEDADFYTLTPPPR